MSGISDESLDRLRSLLDSPAIPGGRYRLDRPLGRGSMGEVWRARDLALDRDVAIKVCADARDAARARRRFEREAKVAARLEHPAIPPVHDRGELEDGRPFYVMRLLPGDPLSRSPLRVAPRNERLRRFLELCEAAAHAHREGFVHRDLKPDNVMVGPSGEVYVTDWGLSRQIDIDIDADADAQSDAKSGAASAAGTEGYMAPEQREGASVDARADVFALGGVLSFLFGGDPAAGAAPDGPSRAARPNRHDKRLDAIVAKARAPRRDDRYADGAALARDVARLMDGEPIEAYRENALERIGRVADRNQAILWLIVAYLVIRVLVFFFVRP